MSKSSPFEAKIQGETGRHRAVRASSDLPTEHPLTFCGSPVATSPLHGSLEVVENSIKIHRNERIYIRLFNVLKEISKGFGRDLNGCSSWRSVAQILASHSEQDLRSAELSGENEKLRKELERTAKILEAEISMDFNGFEWISW